MKYKKKVLLSLIIRFVVSKFFSFKLPFLSYFPTLDRTLCFFLLSSLIYFLLITVMLVCKIHMDHLLIY